MLIVKDRFLKKNLALSLRAEFETRFGDPLAAQAAGRFVWDYWNVPNQYTLLRTLPERVFSPRNWKKTLEAIAFWGRENLGCHSLSKPWLSAYVEGCEQKWHGDLPHGPFAFVLSLTPQKRIFSGGETMLLRPRILDYWNASEQEFSQGMNAPEILESIAPDFNRLVLFDPRIPHAVSPVSGVTDLCQARLVIHGWFSEPRPYVVGPLDSTEVITALERSLNNIYLANRGRLAPRGLCVLRWSVAPSGRVTRVQVLVNTLHGGGWSGSEIARDLVRELRGFSYSSKRIGSVVTAPVEF